MSPSANLLSRLLLELEDWRVVVALVVAVLVIRLIYMGYRKGHPLPPPPPRTTPPPYRLQVVVEYALYALALVPLILFYERVSLPVTIAIIVGWLALVHWAVSRVFDNISLTGKWAARLPEKTDQKPKDLGLEAIDTLLIALILVFGLVRPFLLQTFFIPSASMEPTLLGPFDPALASSPQFAATLVKDGPKREGDKLIANRFVLRFRAPRRGEIVIFEPATEAMEMDPNLKLRRWILENPGEANQKLLPAWNYLRAANRKAPLQDASEMLYSLPELQARRDAFIKRVVGEPGDRIRIDGKKGLVFINGKAIEEPYLPKTPLEQLNPPSLPRSVPRKLPPFPELRANADGTVDANNLQAFFGYTDEEGVTHSGLLFEWVLEWYDTHVLYAQRLNPHVDGDVFVVPADAVFVMGDNRGGSFDSRYWGVVPLSHIKGRAVAVFWPPKRIKLL